MIICPGFLELFYAYRKTDIGAILLALRIVAKPDLTIVYNRNVGNGSIRIFTRSGEGQKYQRERNAKYYN
jgi:hypothetical protein